MPLTAQQSYELGTPEGRDRINQQLRSDPQYAAFLRSIGVNPSAPQLSDQQRQQAQAWVRQHLGGIGSLQIDPNGNLNNPHGFKQELEQWGPVAAAGAGIAAPFAIPALFGAGGGGASGAAAAAGPGGLYEAAPAALASQGTSAGLGTMATGAGATGSALGTAATGGGVAGGLKEFFTDPTNLAGIASVVGGLASRNNNGQQEQDMDELRRISRIAEAQMRRTDPLHQVATNLAFGRMPTNYRQGVQLKDVQLPE